MSNDIIGLIDQLYRDNYGKLVATLLRQFGNRHLDSIEDAAQECFTKALQKWTESNIPDQPEAWLYTVARNAILKALQKDAKYISDDGWLQRNQGVDGVDIAIFRSDLLQDNLLGALYLCTNNDFSEKTQIALILKTLAGFTIEEIATALYISEDAVAKMLVRARQHLREDKTPLLDPYIIVNEARTQTVLQAIYLIFNLGYFDQHTQNLIRTDLCYEAMYLAKLMASHSSACKADCYALFALILLHSARLEARFNEDGGLLSLKEQDREKWNRSLFLVGAQYLNRSFEQNKGEATRFQIEAAITFLHTVAKSYEETPWEQILKLYNLLEASGSYPSASLAKAYVLSELNRSEEALALLQNSHFQHIPSEIALLTKAKILEYANEIGESRQLYETFLSKSASPKLRDFIALQLRIKNN